MVRTPLARPVLADLVEGIRSLLDPRQEPGPTALAVADHLRADLPALDVLSAAGREGSVEGFRRHVVQAEPRFSIQVVAWLPGQKTPVHDHIAWGVVAILGGTEQELRYRDHGSHLTLIDQVDSPAGTVSGFAPPGDIHKVRNPGPGTAMSLHVYGADLSGGRTSVHRVYDHPVLGPGEHRRGAPR